MERGRRPLPHWVGVGLVIRLPRVLHSDEIYLLSVTQGDPDENGEPIVTEERLKWEGLNVQLIRSSEMDEDQETSSRGYRVVGENPPREPRYYDLVEYRGDRYRISSYPDVRSGPYRINYTSFEMERAEG